MNKINFKGLGTKVVGLAAGTVAAGFVQKGIAKLGLSGMLSNVAIIAVGALGPDLLGKRNPLIGYAGDAIIVKGVSAILTEQFPSLISGTDDITGPYDDITGPYDDIAGDYLEGVDEPGMVAGPDDYVSVSGGNSI